MSSDVNVRLVDDPSVPDGSGVEGSGSGPVDWDGSDQDSDRQLKFYAALNRTFDEAESLLIRKHKDYGPKNISLSPGGPLNGLRVRMWDKLARINHLVDHNLEPSNESLRDSFIDLMNYSAIALLVLDGNWPKGDE